MRTDASYRTTLNRITATAMAANARMWRDSYVRIDRAKFMLQNYELKLDDLATRCGYHDTPYFCRVFKRIAKITPVEYRLRTQPKPAL